MIYIYESGWLLSHITKLFYIISRRLLWPIKQKYGKSISWADLMILTGNVALESMGFPTFGFAGGREDVWEPEDDVNWGQETSWLSGDKRYPTNRHPEALANPLGAVQMGLIYVNPEGPNSNPDPLLSAKDIRETFGRMAMNDEETVALIAGGHTFGKTHGAGDAKHVGVEPEEASIESQGFGWKNSMGRGNAGDTITSGLEGAWTYTPTKWDHSYFEIMFGYEWELTKSPAGAYQWKPKQGAASNRVPDAHDPHKQHPPMMLTSDLALREDPIYRQISWRFYQNPDRFQVVFAKAWYKLTHRDMGPFSRCLGPEVPPPQLWQDPLPPLNTPPLSGEDQAKLKQFILNTSGLSIKDIVATAWASASTFRNTDKRGGANGARILLKPQRDWPVNEPAQLSRVSKVYKQIQKHFPTPVSMADLIVLGGCAGVEAAAKLAGHDVVVPFTPGRTDATQDMTDVESFAVLEPKADGFRNYLKPSLFGVARPEELLIEKAYMLNLTVPEMTVLIGGLRVLGIGTSHTSPMTDRVGQLTNDFFTNLLDMGTVWSQAGPNLYQGRDRTTGQAKYSATRVDLVFGSHSVLRALAEVHACQDSEETFVRDFCKAFAKIMDLDRFDVIAPSTRSRL